MICHMQQKVIKYCITLPPWLSYIYWLAKTTTHPEQWDSVDQSTSVSPTNPGLWVVSRRSYHQWWSMGATLVVVSPSIIRYLPTSEGWENELVLQRQDIGKSVGMTSMGNQNQFARMEAQWLTYYTNCSLKMLKNFIDTQTKSSVWKYSIK